MTDFFKNNPNAFRYCLLYEFLQGSSIEQAYSNICAVIGKEAVDHKNFVRLFIQFSKEKFNNKKKEKSITEIFRNNKYALRVCILYECLKYQKAKASFPIYGVFVNFCKVIGVEDVLKYPEFEFWFYRFLSGEFDLNFERDKDKKIYELMDMPIDVMKNIVEYLDIFDRAKLVQTSRSLQTFVEDQKLFHHTLKLKVSYSTATVSFGKSVDMVYYQNGNDCVKNYKKRVTRVRGVPYWKQAIWDIEKVLKNPNLHLHTFAIDFSNVFTKNLFNDSKDAFKFTHHLNVKNVILSEYSWEELLNIIPSLKPGYLTSIDIASRFPSVELLKNVFEMEQWKQAKYLRLNDSFIWPLRNLYHFKKFATDLNNLSVDDVREMKEILFKSPDFEKCLLYIDDDIDIHILAQEFGDALREYPHVYHYPIPNSTDYFKIEVRFSSIDITRKKV